MLWEPGPGFFSPHPPNLPDQDLPEIKVFNTRLVGLLLVIVS